MPAGRVQRRAASPEPKPPPLGLAPSEHPLLASALARSFQLVAGIAFVALTTTALVVVLVPSSTKGRAGFAVELAFVGLTLVALAVLLGRRSAREVVDPLELLDAALVAVTSGDLTVRVRLDRAAAEIQRVADSFNAMILELARLRVVEMERTKDERVRRELTEAVHASLDLDHVVQRAVEVIGGAFDVDRVHIRLRERAEGRLAAEWRRTDDVAPMRTNSPADEVYALIHLIGVTDDRDAVVIDDTTDAGRFSIEQRVAFEEAGVRSALKFPIVVGSRVAGVLVATEQTAARHWSESDLTLIAGFAREIGRALDHVRAFQLQDEMVERLEVLDRAKNDFLAEVSRELRGPLSSVLGYIELLTDASAETVTDKQRHMLRIVERNGEQLIVLIDNLLTMSRLEAGTFEPRLAPMHLDGVIRRVCDAAAPAAVVGLPDLEVEIEADLALVADEGQIERALHNLLSNALKFTPEGGRVNLSARAEGDEIVIDVRDTGIGIAIDEQDDLFARFFNAKSGPRRATLGTGLGLYVVKQIVDGHDGRVGLVSVEGRGSTFTIRLPARPKAALVVAARGPASVRTPRLPQLSYGGAT